MAFVILSHPVADFNHWKTVYDQDAERRSGAGLKEVTVGQDSTDSNMVYMIYETSNTDVIQQMLSDPNLAEAMKEAGVTGPPKVVILK
jgi:hypothetical protein